MTSPNLTEEETKPDRQKILSYESFLGYGSFGIILRALQPFGPPIAVKFIFPSGTRRSSPPRVTGYEVVLSLRHANLMQMYRIDRQNLTKKDLEKIFSHFKESEDLLLLKDRVIGTAIRCEEVPTIQIQMELCGKTLRHWLDDDRKKDGQLSPIHFDIIRGLIEGLSYLHDRDIIHRGLEPASIMFSNPESSLPIKIGGFAQSTFIYAANEFSLDMLSSHVGTVHYMAPELRFGVYTKQSDFFALGLIIWEVVQFVGPMDFDKLVYDEETNLIKFHGSFRKMIIGLTKRRVTDRFKDLTSVRNLYAMGSRNQCGLQLNIDFALPKFCDSQESLMCLDDMEVDSIIASHPSHFFEGITNNSKFDIILGRGAFGFVLRDVTNEGDKTAVKFVFPSEIDEKQQEQVAREFDIARILPQHPNIVRTRGVEERYLTSEELQKMFTNILNDSMETLLVENYIRRAKRYETIKVVCIRMDLCGESLRSWLRVRHNLDDLNIQQIQQFEIITGIIRGLKHLHENKIMHRDIKPENIMFSKVGFVVPVKLGDFGLSRKIYDDGTESNSLTCNVGARSYMASEVRSGIYDKQADIFSLGLVMWEVLQGISRHDFNRLVLDGEEELVEDHPIMVGIKQIIISLTKRKPKDRTKTLDELDPAVKFWKENIKRTTYHNK
ncbi:serine/threonine-protein kinase D [Folsomia candida]|uniref:Serine/threonine-protein kinase pdik1l-B n=1 Tax=Folsomia candida TaxID=158441 RepID=A0A226DQU9_FOLCA|nr:serine/threonine-protein kinase D [Folsomia candida]OXA46576.1 Serine/threonine-protein kinase pdik1l-B [Folsomia candida]